MTYSGINKIKKLVDVEKNCYTVTMSTNLIDLALQSSSMHPQYSILCSLWRRQPTNQATPSTESKLLSVPPTVLYSFSSSIHFLSSPRRDAASWLLVSLPILT